MNNYGPALILPIISKLIEKSINKQLMDHLERKNLLSAAQFRYRMNRSTDIAAILFVDNIRKNIDIGKLVAAIFIHLTKAFVTLSHSVLLSEPSVYGIKGVELEWFTNYLFSRKQEVVIQNTKLNVKLSPRIYSETCTISTIF